MIRIEALTYRVGEFALKGIDLMVGAGEHFVLLGPPGSGKSVLLECLCGLNHVASGRILLDGEDVTRLEPRLRGIGYVPQDHALLPHLDVKANIAFGLRAQGVSRTEAQARTADVARYLGIDHLLDRGVGALSGGEAQRTALARALVLKPRVLILDEPVSALDEATRQEVCAEIRRVQRELSVTTLHVSHNLEEAFTLADRAGIIREGAFEQIDTMEGLLRRPRTVFAARFMRCENLFTGRALQRGTGDDGDTTRVSVANRTFVVPGRHEGGVTFAVRPECIRVLRGEDAAEGMSASLRGVVDCGTHTRLELNGDPPLTVHLPRGANETMCLTVGDRIGFAIRPEDCHVIG